MIKLSLQCCVLNGAGTRDEPLRMSACVRPGSKTPGSGLEIK